MKRRSLTARPIEVAVAFVAGALAALAAKRTRRERRRPRVRPCNEVETAVEALGELHPAIPQLVRGRLVVPLRNDSPAVAQLVVAELEVGEARHIELLRSLAAWAIAAVVVEIRVGELPDFTIDLVVHGAGGFQRASWRWRSLTRRYERLL